MNTTPTPGDLSARLLACPFCGGRAEMDTRQAFRALATGNMETAVAVYCADGPCSVQVTLCRSDMPELDDDGLVALATECWNRRAALSALPAAGRLEERHYLAAWEAARSLTHIAGMAHVGKAWKDMADAASKGVYAVFGEAVDADWHGRTPWLTTPQPSAAEGKES